VSNGPPWHIFLRDFGMADLQQKRARAEHRSDELLHQKQIIVSDNQAQAQRFATLQQEHLALLRQHEVLQQMLARERGRLVAFLGKTNPAL
jgi:hypothetical protein